VLGTTAVGNIAANTAIALEPAQRIEHRYAAHGIKDVFALIVGTAIFQFAIRLVGVDGGVIFLPRAIERLGAA